MYDLIIIGAGPAGLTAGIYAGRFRLDSVIFEKMSAGGQIILSYSIENYPGFPGGISTFELIDKFKAQVDELGVKIENKEITQIKEISESGRTAYELHAQEEIYKTRSVIIATGAESKRLGIPGEDRLIGRGVSYCATCDGPLFKNKEVVVIGGGDKAVEEALFLTSYAQGVSIIHRRSELRASKILVEKAKENPKIKFILDSVVEEVCGEKKVDAVKIRNVKTDSKADIACQGVFIFVGITPNTSFLKNFLEFDEQGFIITGSDLRTKKEGIFAAGDCRSKSLYQVISACGEGATAADSAHKYLLKL